MQRCIVKGIKRKNETKPKVYNVRVKDNHNYFVNGILVHNCDDPIKNMEEATSKVYQDKIYDWYKSTLYTRLEKNNAIVLTLTRWSENDLAGKLLAEMKNNPESDKWTILSFPAIKEGEPTELDPREDGQPLWENKFPLTRLKSIKSSVGSRVWTSLFMQRPSPETGNIVKRDHFKFYTKLPEMDYYIISWDFTFKDNKKSDFVCGQVWGKKGIRRYLMDLTRDRMNFNTSLQTMITFSVKWPDYRENVIESKANGPAIVSAVKDKIPKVVEYNPVDSKLARAHAVAPDFEAGNIYIPHPDQAPWVHDYIEEWLAFPNGKKDDQVDTTSQALLKLNGEKWIDDLLKATSEPGIIDLVVPEEPTTVKDLFWPNMTQ